MPPVAVAAGIGGGLGLIGNIISSNTQSNAQQQALALQQQQDAERIREYNQQQAAAAYQWQVQQAQLAPYRAARAAVLGKYGINVSQPNVAMLPGFGTPGGIKVPTNLPSGGTPIPGAGTNPMLLGAGGLGAGVGLASLLNKPQGPGAFAGTVIDPSGLNNFGAYTQQQPGQIPSGTVPGSSFIPDPSLQNVDQGGGAPMNVPIDYTGEGAQ